VLFGIAPALLERMLLPVGDFRSSNIRAGASAWLRVATARQPGICFIPDNDHAAFIRRRRTHDTSGEIVTRAARSSAATPGWKRSHRPAQGAGHRVSAEPAVRRADRARLASRVVGTKEELRPWRN